MLLTSRYQVVLGLRFYACSRCETVHAEPVVPTTCPTCDAPEIREITSQPQADPYFWA